MKKIIKKQGFTIIEILISIAIISIISASFYMIINNSIKSNKKNEVDIYSYNIAQTVIESMRVYSKNYNKLGVDLNDDKINDIDFNDIESSWNDYDSTKEIYKEKINEIEVEEDNNIYSVKINSLKRQKNNNNVYTVELHVTPGRGSSKITKTITQIYTK